MSSDLAMAYRESDRYTLEDVSLTIACISYTYRHKLKVHNSLATYHHNTDRDGDAWYGVSVVGCVSHLGRLRPSRRPRASPAAMHSKTYLL